MPGVMDIQHLLCEPATTTTTTEQALPSSNLAPPKPQEPVIDRFPAYSAFEYEHYSREYWQQHHYHDNEVHSNGIHGDNCRSCRSNSISSTNSNNSSSSSIPPSPPPMLVRSRTTSDASSQASASPREWAYPATPRDEDSTMIRLGYEPYFLVPQQQQQQQQQQHQQAFSPVNNNTSCYSSAYPLHVAGSGRYRAPSQGSSSSSASSSSSRRSRSTSASSLNAPVQTRMAWTPTEDDLLQQGYDEGLSWAMISATYLPHRSRGCCWGRFKTLQSKNLVDPKRQNARLFRRPWKAVDGVKRYHQHH